MHAASSLEDVDHDTVRVPSPLDVPVAKLGVDGRAFQRDCVGRVGQALEAYLCLNVHDELGSVLDPRCLRTVCGRRVDLLSGGAPGLGHFEGGPPFE